MTSDQQDKAFCAQALRIVIRLSEAATAKRDEVVTGYTDFIWAVISELEALGTLVVGDNATGPDINGAFVDRLRALAHRLERGAGT